MSTKRKKHYLDQSRVILFGIGGGGSDGGCIFVAPAVADDDVNVLFTVECVVDEIDG